MKHYSSFIGGIREGVFKKEPISNYLDSLEARARYYRSPIGSQETVESFIKAKENLSDCVDNFLMKALVNGKLLPIEGIVCVEDEFSAVFVENDANYQRSMRLVSYRQGKKEKDMQKKSPSILLSSSLIFRSHSKDEAFFSVVSSYGAFVEEGKIERILGEDRKAMEMDIFTAAVTVIEQLCYMDRVGIIINAGDRGRH